MMAEGHAKPYGGGRRNAAAPEDVFRVAPPAFRRYHPRPKPQ